MRTAGDVERILAFVALWFKIDIFWVVLAGAGVSIFVLREMKT